MAVPRRQQQMLLALLGSLVFVSPHSSTFAMLGSRPSGRVPSRAVNAMPHVLPEFHSLPWAEDLDGKDALNHAKVMSAVDKTVDHMDEFDKKLVEGLSFQELQEYDRSLVQLIADLEDKIAMSQSEVLRSAMRVQSEEQVLWHESMLQSIGDLRRQLRRVRDREGKLMHVMANTNRGFLQNLIRAAAIALGGTKAGPKSDYPASGVSSYSGEPAEPIF